MYKLSICFTVYNQLEILKKRIDTITEFLNEYVELVISDDCSTEDVADLIDSYKNERIRYYRTPHNLGHDLNILHGIKCCKSNYVMVLRTRDNINTDAINQIIDMIEKHPNAGYYYTSAIDENGAQRLSFEDKKYNKGLQSAKAHFSLPVHPSGNIYNKMFLDMDLYEEYIKSYFDNIYGFTVHQLIRSDLSQKADFITSSIIGWIYEHTLEATDIAVNSASNKKNVYCPELSYPRYRCEFDFSKKEVRNGYKYGYLENIIKSYYYLIGYRSIVICADKRYSNHYGSLKERYKPKMIKKELDCITRDLISGLPNDQSAKLKSVMKREGFKILTLYRIKTHIRNTLVRIKYR